MSDLNIPFEVQTEIILRIPDTKSLIRCRSVSKAWKSVIDSKKFVKAHILRHQPHNCHLLIKTLDCSACKDCTGNMSPTYKDIRGIIVKYWSIVDDDEDTFPHHQKVSVFVPDSVGEFSDRSIYSYDSVILGSCYGLFCLYEPEKDTAIIWNPSIRKTVAIALPNKCKRNFVLGMNLQRIVVGFGVCPRNLDLKLVKIAHVYNSSRLQDVNASTQVEVFTLRSSGGTWRSPLSSDLPHKSIHFRSSQAVVDGFLYWDAVDRINVDDGPRTILKLIMSFDFTSEEFTKVNLPDCLALDPNAHLTVCNLRGSLVVLNFQFNIGYSRENHHVWMMIGHGCTRSFDKLYSIKVPNVSLFYTTLGFRKSGAPIIQVDNDYYRHERALAIYEPESKSITNIGVYGLCDTFYVNSYMETLLLLGH